MGRYFLAVLAIMVVLPALGQVTREHRLGAGDVVRITVFQQPEFALETQVSDEGAITYPLIGAVQLGGLTPSAAAALIANRLREGRFLQRPFVNLTVTQYRSIQVSVLGHVARPGRFAFEQAQTRLTEALALAGGATPAASDVVWLLTAKPGGGEHKVEIDLPALAAAAAGALDPLVRDGDVIFVPRAPVFYIYGEVQRPGQYRLERGMTVMQALAVGGGLNTRGTERGLRLSRRDANGQIAPRSAVATDSVEPDDIIFVRESIF